MFSLFAHLDDLTLFVRVAALGTLSAAARECDIPVSRTLNASQAYLAKNGTPQQPEDLSSHHLIGNSHASPMNLWERQDAKSGLQVKGQTLTDNSAVLLSMVRHGLGIARLLDIVAAPFVKTGELVPLLLPHFDVKEIPVYAVMLQERHRLPKIRACVEFWGEYLEAIRCAQ